MFGQIAKGQRAQACNGARWFQAPSGVGWSRWQARALEPLVDFVWSLASEGPSYGCRVGTADLHATGTVPARVFGRRGVVASRAACLKNDGSVKGVVVVGSVRGST